jgi:hypothetical protein
MTPTISTLDSAAAVPPSKTVRADEGLLPDKYDRLNRGFYDAQPWLYFDHRLVNLARVTASIGQPEQLASPTT